MTIYMQLDISGKKTPCVNTGRSLYDDFSYIMKLLQLTSPWFYVMIKADLI